MSSNTHAIQGSDPRHPLGIKNGAATFMLALAGLMMANLAPLIITALEGLGLSGIDAGAVLTWGLLASALVGLGSSRLAAGSRRRMLALAGLAVGTVGFALAAFVSDQSVAVTAFIIGGAGVGAAISTSGAAIAALRNPNRVSAMSGIINRILVMIVLAIIPIMGLSQVNVFGALAVISLLGFAVAAWLPDAPEHAAPVDVTQSLKIAEPRRITWAGIAILIVFPLWGTSEDAIWTMAGVLGDSVGLAPAALGTALSAAAGGGLITMLIVLIAGKKLGRAVPLALALALGGVLKIWVGFTADPTTLAWLIILINTVYAFAFSLFIATAAGLDARGRWSAPLSGAYLVGSSFAPLIGAWLIETVGISTFCLLMGIVSFIVIVPTVIIARVSVSAERALEREHAAAHRTNATANTNPAGVTND